MDSAGDLLREEDIMPNDTIKIEGFVEIRNGDTVIKVKNRFVQTLLQYILNTLSLSATINNVTIRGPMNSYNMYVGSDTGTVTAYNTAALTFPLVGPGPPGTAPTTIVGSTQNPSDGVFRIIITATWNAGTLPGNPTIGEMALYKYVWAAGNLKTFAWSALLDGSGPILTTRLAAADGAFTPFAINSANPLIIVWTIQLSFV